MLLHVAPSSWTKSYFVTSCLRNQVHQLSNPPNFELFILKYRYLKMYSCGQKTRRTTVVKPMHFGKQLNIPRGKNFSKFVPSFLRWLCKTAQLAQRKHDVIIAVTVVWKLSVATTISRSPVRVTNWELNCSERWRGRTDLYTPVRECISQPVRGSGFGSHDRRACCRRVCLEGPADRYSSSSRVSAVRRQLSTSLTPPSVWVPYNTDGSGKSVMSVYTQPSRSTAAIAETTTIWREVRFNALWRRNKSTDDEATWCFAMWTGVHCKTTFTWKINSVRCSVLVVCCVN